MWPILLIVVAIVLLGLAARGTWRMSQRSRGVKQRATAVFAGRRHLDSDEFRELFPEAARPIAGRLRDMLKDILIVDVRFIRPEDRLIADLGLGQVDGLDGNVLDCDTRSEWQVSIFPLFENSSDPTVAEVVSFLFDRSTTEFRRT
ncbi:MAG: hypothetical protein U0795_03830 [Pirellulales bacterium]